MNIDFYLNQEAFGIPGLTRRKKKDDFGSIPIL